VKRLKQTGFELVVLGVIGLIVAAGANGVRAKGSITLGKNYFYIPPPTPTPPTTDETSGKEGSVETGEGTEAPATEPEHSKHGYQVLTYEAVAALLEDTDTQAGLNVFLDARNDHSYEDGHIPGAVQCDPYQIAQYWDNVAPLLEGALKIVVYCGGGDCDDSIFMCRELLDQDLPKEAIYLYEGGWKEWTANGGQVEKGRTE